MPPSCSLEFTKGFLLLLCTGFILISLFDCLLHENWLQLVFGKQGAHQTYGWWCTLRKKTCLIIEISHLDMRVEMGHVTLLVEWTQFSTLVRIDWSMIIQICLWTLEYFRITLMIIWATLMSIRVTLVSEVYLKHFNIRVCHPSTDVTFDLSDQPNIHLNLHCSGLSCESCKVRQSASSYVTWDDWYKSNMCSFY